MYGWSGGCIERRTAIAHPLPQRVGCPIRCGVREEERKAFCGLERGAPEPEGAIAPPHEIALAVGARHSTEAARGREQGEVDDGLLDQTQKERQVSDELRATDRDEVVDDVVSGRNSIAVGHEGFDDARERRPLALAEFHAGTAVLRLACSSAASSLRRVLPTTVCGSDARNSTCRGTLKSARVFRQCAMISSAVASPPGLSTT